MDIRLLAVQSALKDQFESLVTGAGRSAAGTRSFDSDWLHS